MRVKILQIADTKNKQIKLLEQDYEKKLSHFFKLEIVSLQASKSDDRTKCQSEEKTKFLEKLNENAFTIALDETGKELSSEAFANLIKEQRDFGPGEIIFLIGGSNGLHPDVKAKANFTLSFSKMTFTHEMVRVFLKEQLYRAASILAGKRYHK